MQFETFKRSLKQNGEKNFENLKRIKNVLPAFKNIKKFTTKVILFNKN